ncbi:Tubulin polyglutamylase TTLL5 [Geodia barretti]|uniref:Tubulin--tyrosine ligase-like protein 5 n=1 Tax=Geodia barretti TaxID=519541 RepID=A0AA35RYF0_GEOBA|nr:Tubulin polyglutamylase TTLL5 [Geodia barretti]
MMEIEESSCPSESGEEAGGGKDIRGSSVNSETSEKSSDANLSVLWTGSAGKTPLIQFRADALLGLETPPDHPYSGNHRLTFKLSGENRLVHTLLLSHGFSEVSLMNARFNVYWSGSHIQMSEIRALMPHQRINHFPRSYMITRKDRLCQNISRMQHAKGVKHFNIIPTTFVLPDELPQFRVHFRKKRGTWIVKPVSLSRGRGITIINHPNQAKSDEPMVVSQYIERPLIVNALVCFTTLH